MIRSSIFVLAFPLIVIGCDKPADTKGAAPAASASAAPATEKGAVPEVKPAAPVSAAAAFPATALAAKGVADYTIGLPPGGKVDKANDDKASMETPDYKIMIAVAKANDTAKMKDMLGKAPGYRAIVDSPDGLLAEMDEKGKKSFVLARYVTVGDKILACDSALTKPPKDEAKAKEAWDVCGTLKKK